MQNKYFLKLCNPYVLLLRKFQSKTNIFSLSGINFYCVYDYIFVRLYNISLHLHLQKILPIQFSNLNVTSDLYIQEKVICIIV